VSSAIWLGAQRQAIEKGETPENAVIFADKILRKLLPSHHVVDSSEIMRSKSAAAGFLVFFRFWNTAFNIGRRNGPGAFSEFATPKNAAKAIGYALALHILGSLVRGQGPDPGEPWSQWFLRKLLTGQMSKYPFLGELGEFGWSIAVGGKRREPRNNSITGMMTAIYQLAAKAADGDKDADVRLESLLRGISLATGQPWGQPIRSGFYGYRAATGKVPVRGAGDVIGGGIYGQGQNQAANIPTLIEDFLEAGWAGLEEHPGPR
jgi:hypothetical protein